MQNKDLIHKKIEEISDSDDIIIAKLKDGRQHAYLIEPFLNNIDSVIETLKPFEPCSLIVYNTKENFDIILKGWKKISDFKRNFSIYFVNPFSRSEKRWTVYPSTHNMISGGNIEEGLKSLFATVEITTEKEIKKIIES